MPDIFGRHEGQYTLRRDLREAGQLEAYERSRADMMPFAVPRHDFESFGAGAPLQYRASGDAAAAFGYVTNNMLQVMSYIDEIMYTAYRLPRFISINTAIDEGARSYGYRVLQRTGMAAPIAADGTGAPSAAVAGGLVTNPLIYYGIVANWTLDEARGAMMGNFPLPTATIDAAVQGAIDKLQEQTLTGGDGAMGILNQPTTGTNAVTSTNVSAANMRFTDLTAVQIRTLINNELSGLIEDSEEVFGGVVTDGAAVFLPGPQYDRLSDLYIGDNAERTLLRSIMDDNPWTNYTGNPVMFERCLELAGILETAIHTSTDRMVTCIKDERVAEVGVSIEPRLIRLQDDLYSIKGPVESKHGNAWVKRPKMIRYYNGI